MPGVFISYRRQDSSGYAGRLFDIVSKHFGRQNTFMDLDAIQGGDDFSAVIQDKIGISDVMLAVIGDKWLAAADENGTHRLDNPHDFVRLEIGKALERGIRVIPVLVGGAAIPHAEDLPLDLQKLCERQAVEIRDAHFHSDVEQLVAGLHRSLRGGSLRPTGFGGKRAIWAILSIVGVVVVAAGFLLFRHLSSGARADSAAPVSNVAGKWSANVKYDWGDSYGETFDFEVNGKEVSGTASFLGVARGILDGKFENNRISFTTKSLVTISSDEKTYEDKHHYEGSVEKNSIRFTMMTDSSVESHVPVHFVASRVKVQ